MLTATTPAGCYRQLAAAFAAAAGPDDTWLQRVAQAMAIWCDLFQPLPIPARAPERRNRVEVPV